MNFFSFFFFIYTPESSAAGGSHKEQLSLSLAGFKALLLALTMYRQREIPWNISPLLDTER